MDQFKAVRIETDEQLIHVVRYILLNPYTGYVVKSLSDIEIFPWSAFGYYLQGQNGFVETNEIMSHFPSKEKFKKTVLDQADYQRRLKEIEHLVLE